MKHPRRVAATVAAAVLLWAVAPAPGQNPASPGPTPAKAPADPVPTPDQVARKLLATRTHGPSPLPDRVILTWPDADTTTSQAVTWRTDTSVTAAVAQIAPADPGPGVEPGWKGYESAKVRTVAARTTPLATTLNTAHYHSARFTDLRPKTRYMYRVGDGRNWSEWFQFDTPSPDPEPFGFIYFGDAQNAIKSLWSRVVRGAYSDMPKAKFIVHAGDLVQTGADDADWGEWHSAAGWINGMVPSIPTPGNHEYGGKSGLTAHWRPQFTLPENGPAGLAETCYYHDVQGVRVISLNSNEKVAEQTPWLEGVLAARPPSIRWTVVTFHHPIYSTAKGRDNKSVREAWRPVFDRHQPDLVLTGHDHTYGRSGLMADDNVLGGSRVRALSGTVYVVSVSGAKMYELGDLPWAASRAGNTQLYQLIRVDGDTLRYEARTARGDIYDAFELKRRAGGGNTLEERPQEADPDRGRRYENAAAGVAILALVAAAVGWAVRRR